MISKELFCEILNNIKKQEEIDQEISEAIGKRCEGYPIVFGGTDYYRESLLQLLHEVMNDRNEYIEWWLWETDSYIVWDETTSPETKWDLHTPESLYNYLTGTLE